MICFGFGVCLTDGLFGCWFSLFYKEFCFAFDVYIGFTNGEYHVARADFIAPCGGTKGQGRRTLREPFLLYPEPRKRGSVDSNSLTQGNRCGGVDYR